MKKVSWKSFLIKYSIILLLLVADIVTKVVFEKRLADTGETITFIDGFLSFTYVQNTGAAFGIFGNGIVFLIIMSAIMIALFVFMDVITPKQNGWYWVGFCLIMAGAIGNLYDRIFTGFVRDFIQFEFMSFPVFNLADTFLTVGIICYTIFFLFFGIKDSKKV